MQLENVLHVFTDGACSNNGKKNARASYAVVFPDHNMYNNAQKVPINEPQTNNRGELHACLCALEQANIIDPTGTIKVIVYTDSMLLINSMTLWIKTWKRNNWITSTKTPVKNEDLLRKIDNLISSRNQVSFQHVEAHTKNTDWKSNYNRMVDEAAKAALNQ